MYLHVEFFLVCMCIVLLPHVFHVGLTLRMLSIVGRLPLYTRVIMAGAVGGRLETFNSHLESVTVYLERVELYFLHEQSEAGEVGSRFFNLLGRKTYA